MDLQLRLTRVSILFFAIAPQGKNKSKKRYRVRAGTNFRGSRKVNRPKKTVLKYSGVVIL